MTLSQKTPKLKNEGSNNPDLQSDEFDKKYTTRYIKFCQGVWVMFKAVENPAKIASKTRLFWRGFPVHRQFLLVEK
jgi:hypothetical protein